MFLNRVAPFVFLMETVAEFESDSGDASSVEYPVEFDEYSKHVEWWGEENGGWAPHSVECAGWECEVSEIHLGVRSRAVRLGLLEHLGRDVDADWMEVVGVEVFCVSSGAAAGVEYACPGEFLLEGVEKCVEAFR